MATVDLTHDEAAATRAALILQSDKLTTQLINQRMTTEAEKAAVELRAQTESALAKIPVSSKPKRKSTAKKTSSSS